MIAARSFAAATVLAVGLLAAAACSPGAAAHPQPAPPRGGTLRVSVMDRSILTDQTMLDPALEFDGMGLELFRCCLGRTLLSYSGKPASQGGTILHPDVAAALPAISPDGLTWTFHLRRGVHYSPPLQRDTVSAQDFVRTMNRLAKIGTAPGQPGASYYSVIVGFDDYVNGKASSISGIETPDDRTLVFHLNSPTGDFAYRVAEPNLVPIPPSPQNPGAPFGVYDGHDAGSGGVLVSPGPYMLEGGGAIDFGVPAAQQKTASGWQPAKSIALVRNPSWQAGADPLREAYVDRIEVTVYTGGAFSGDNTPAVQAVIDGKADLELVNGPAPQVPESIISTHRQYVHIDERMDVRYLSLNLAQPPLDDIHVRRAINFVIDKVAARDSVGGPDAGAIASHVGPDPVEDNALTAYDPYPTGGGQGDLAKAKQEMALSRYDSNHDGVCDAPACHSVPVLAFNSRLQQAQLIKADLAKIGIDIALAPKDPGDLFQAAFDPTQHWAMALMVAWGADYPNGSNFFVPLFASGSIAGSINTVNGPPADNLSLVGASPADLQKWGYPVSDVPGVDDRVAACLSGPGWEQTPCWVRLDQYLMEKVVPWVPMIYELQIELAAPRVLDYTFDTVAQQPALDQVALRR